MADDIDDLLDEVETKYVKGKSSDKKKAVTKTSRKKSDDDEMDKIIDDICGGTDPLEQCNIVRNVPSNSSRSQPKPSKCFPLSIGGSALSKGQSTSVNKRSCDTMRCTSCDFRVVSFDDFQWDRDTDYLFLRNNAPDFDRLKPKLKTKRGNRSYCCQCCHMAVDSLTEVKDLSVKWVCGNH